MRDAICSVEGCEKPVRTRGWCHPHYTRWRRYGSPTSSPVPARPDVCVVDGCERGHYARTWCHAHYETWRTTGDPLTKERGSDLDAMRARVTVEPSGCWSWSSYVAVNGYGRVSLKGRRSSLAHRVMYELAVGPIPDGLTLDHLCRNTRCVNPAHLEPVTQAENNRRAAISRRAEASR